MIEDYFLSEKELIEKYGEDVVKSATKNSLFITFSIMMFVMFLHFI